MSFGDIFDGLLEDGKMGPRRHGWGGEHVPCHCLVKSTHVRVREVA